MKILHFYSKDDKMAAQYVETLRTAMGGHADVRAESQLSAFKRAFKEQRPDIVHLHGCWRWAAALAMRHATRRGARIVLSPHGALEPWVVKQDFWREKLPKLVAYQRRIVRGAFAVVAMGRMEAASLGRMKLNPRIETVRNALVTSTITPAQMALSMEAIYRKVLDSFTYPLMAPATTMALRAFIKAGQTGDPRWLNDEEYQATQHLGPEAWRQLLLYAHEEGIADTVARGVAAVGCEPPQGMDASGMARYSPAPRNKKEAALDTRGDNDLDRLVHALHATHKLLRSGRFTLAHTVALSSLIRQGEADEERLAYRLRTQGLLPTARRAMAVMEQLTGLERGLMPVEAKRGGKTRRIMKSITNHNEIV